MSKEPERQVPFSRQSRAEPHRAAGTPAVVEGPGGTIEATGYVDTPYLSALDLFTS